MDFLTRIFGEDTVLPPFQNDLLSVILKLTDIHSQFLCFISLMSIILLTEYLTNGKYLYFCDLYVHCP